MNKIYRTVYNETTGTWVAVCETAKTHTKSSGKSAVVKAMAAAGLMAVAGVAGAASVTATTADPAVAGGDTTSAKRLKAEAVEAAGGQVQKDANGNYEFDASGNPIVLVAPRHTVNTTAQAQVAVGDNAHSNNGGAVAVGSNAYSGGAQSVAVGMGSSANGGGAVAIGGGVSNGTLQGAVANGNGAVSIGVSSVARDSAVAIGSNTTARGEGAVAIGGANGNYHSDTLGKGTVAIGRNARAKVSILQRDATTHKIDESKLISTTGDNILTQNDATHRYLAFDQDGAKLNSNLNLGQNIAIGDESQAYSHQSIAVGANTMALGVGAIAIGGDDLGQKSDLNKVEGNAGYDAGFTASMKTLQNVDTALEQIRNDYKNKAELQVTNKPQVITNTLANNNKAYVDTTMALGDGSMAIGFKSAAKGSLADAIGMGAMALGNSSVAMGTAAEAQGEFANAIGAAAFATANNANAFGLSAIAEGEYSNAIGTSAASGTKSSAMGYMNRAVGENAVAIGTQNLSGSKEKETTNTVAMGVENNATGELSVAIGSNNTTSGDYATAYGKNNQASAERSAAWGSENTVGEGAAYSTAIGSKINISAQNVYAVGNNIHADLANSVVLGSTSDGTTTSQFVPTDEATVGGVTYGGFAGATSTLGDGAIVSVGAKGSERQIKNVAAGQITADSTDAINGSQLYAVLGANPVVYTDAKGNKLTKKGDKFFNGSDEVPADQVIASMNNGSNSTTSPMALHNVASNLAPVTNSTKTAPTSTIGGVSMQTPQQVQTVRNSTAKNNAATLGDVLNAGWNLKANGSNVDFVTHADTVNFQSTDKSITITPKSSNGVSNIDLKANIQFLKDDGKGGTTSAANNDTATAVKLGDNTYNLGGGDENWNLTVNGGNATTAGGTRNLKTSTTITPTINGNDITFNVNTTPLTVSNGKVNTPAQPNQLVTAQQITNAINNSGWYVNSGKTTGGTSTGAAKTLVKAGEEVKFIAGKGISVAQSARNLTIANTMELTSADGSVTLTQDADGNWDLSTPTGKTYKAGDNISIDNDGTINATLPAGSGDVQVTGKGSVKVENPNNGGTYQVSVPVLANSKGSNATLASVGNNANSLAIGDNAKVENSTKSGNSIAIGNNAKVAKSAGSSIVIGNDSVINTNEDMVVIGNNIKTANSTPKAVVIGSGSTNATVSSDLISIGDSDTNGQWGTAFEFSPETENLVEKFATFNVGDGQGKKTLRQIKGVANGEVSEDSTDAVTGAQLYSVAVAVANMGNSLAGSATIDGENKVGVLGESFTVNTDDSYGAIGTITGKNIAGTGADNIEDAIKQSRTKVKAGQGVTVTDVTKDGATTYTVNGLTVSGSQPNPNAAPDPTGAPAPEMATELTDANGNKYTLGGENNWNLTVSGDASTITTPGAKRNLQNTDGNLNIAQDKDGNINFDLQPKVQIGGDPNVSNNGPITIDGSGTQNTITGLTPNYKKTANNKAPSDAKGKDDQAATLGDVRNVGWNLAQNGIAKDFVNHNDTVNIKDSNTIKSTVSQSGTTSTISFEVQKSKNLVLDTADPNKLGRLTANPVGDTKLLDAGQVANAINTAFWRASDGKAETQVHAGDKVTIKGANGVTVALDNKTQTFTVKGVAITDDGKGNVTELTDANGKKYKVPTADGNDNTVTAVTVNGGQDANANNKEGGNLKLTETTDANGNPTYDVALNDEVDLTDKGSLKVGGDKADSPVTNITAGNIDFGDKNEGSVTGLKQHFADPASDADAGKVINPDNKPDNFADVKNEAATMGDVLNAGWNLKVGDEDADFVQHGDTVAFGNGTGTTAQYKDGVISFDIAKANDPVVPATGKDAGKVPAGVANQYWDSQQVASAINDSGWLISSVNRAGKAASPVLVSPNNEVKFIAGEGIDIQQKGKELTFNAKIVDGSGKQLKLNDNGEYVVNIVTPDGKTPVQMTDDGDFITGGNGGAGDWTVVGVDENGKPQQNKIDGTDSKVKFAGDDNVNATINLPKDPQKDNTTGIQVGLNDVVNVGGKPDAANPNQPVTIDGKQGNITFNGDKPVQINGDQDGNLKVGNDKGEPINIVNVAAGENPTDAVNVSQLLDTVGAASAAPITDENGVPVLDKNGNPMTKVSTTGANGEEYTLKTYNVKEQGEYLTNNVVEAVSKMNEQGIKFFHTNEDENFVPEVQDTNTVDSSAKGGLATAIGVKAEANGKQSLAIGNEAKALGEQSIAIGTKTKVSGNNSGAIGDPTEVTGDGSYSIGNNNKIATNSTFALGSNITKTADNSVFLGDSAGTDVAGAGADGEVKEATVNNLTYGGFAGQKANGLVAVGGNGQVRRVSGVAAGEISATSTDAINGSQLYSALSNSGVYVTSNGAAPTEENLVKLGSKDGALNFVDGNGTTARVEGNTVTFDVKPGYAEGIEAGNNVEFNYKPVYETDAGGVTTDPNKAKKDANGDPVAKMITDKNGNQVQQQTTVIHAKQPDLKPLEDQVQHVENNAYAGVAQAMATAGLPQAYLPGKSMVAIAGGHYKGEQGYALGLSTISDNGSWVFKATASGNSRGNVGGTIGAGYQW